MYPKHYVDSFAPDINHTLVFVGMAFAPEEQWRWDEIIRPSIEASDLTPYRVDLGHLSDAILIDILRGIRGARLLLFDVSASPVGVRNGNVLYELGLAHALRLPEEVVII